MIEIKFKKEDCVNELHRMSAHLGMKLGTPEFMASTDDDILKIDGMWFAATAELARLLQTYAMMSITSVDVTYKMDMPANWKDSSTNNLVEQCRLFLHQALFARWLDYIKADSAMLYRTLNENTASAISHLLALRKKPLR